MISLGLAERRTPAAMALPAAPPAWATALLMLAAAILIRLPDFGNPAIQVDEQFYLLAGDRLLHGQLPYIDIWDRKPIGIFLVYAAIRLLGGVGILQYQAVATLCAAATAWLIGRIARPVAGRWAAIVAGLGYLLWIGPMGGNGGQAPVFYNLPMVGAAALVLRAMRAEDAPSLRRCALAAMALVGIAIQIKYTALVEGGFFGLVLAWQAYRRGGLASTMALSLASVAVALLPTLLAFAYYAHLGAAHTFLFANFGSIGLREPIPNMGIRLLIDLEQIAPLGLCCAASWWQTRDAPDAGMRQWRLFLLGWIAAALLGFACIGGFYYHYLLPAYVPLAIGAAPAFRRRPIGPVLAAIVLLIPLQESGWPGDHDRREARASTDPLLALVPAGVDRGCLQMLDGPPILYHLRHACLASRWPFPAHLIAPVEARAIGVDPAIEMARILRARPLAVVVGPRMEQPTPAEAALRVGLARGYRLAGKAPYEDRTVSVYVRR